MIRPAGPEPLTCERETPSSRARRRTAGDASGRPDVVGLGLGSGVGTGLGASTTFGSGSGSGSAIISPIAPCNLVTLPSTVLPIPTVALSVMMSTISWSSTTVSPTATCQAVISPSTTPSPISGNLNTFVPILSLQCGLYGFCYSRLTWEIIPFKTVWIGCVPTCDSLNGSF